jgi:pilus assembly protein Flp/PilA
MIATYLFGWINSFKREDGQAMAEYGIILALIAAVCIALIATLGTRIVSALNTVLAQL